MAFKKYIMFFLVSFSALTIVCSNKIEEEIAKKIKERDEHFEEILRFRHNPYHHRIVSDDVVKKFVAENGEIFLLSTSSFGPGSVKLCLLALEAARYKNEEELVKFIVQLMVERKHLFFPKKCVGRETTADCLQEFYKKVLDNKMKNAFQSSLASDKDTLDILIAEIEKYPSMKWIEDDGAEGSLAQLLTVEHNMYSPLTMILDNE